MSTEASVTQPEGTPQQPPTAQRPVPPHGLGAAVRRETSSGRVFASAVVAVIVTLLCLYALLESTLQAIGQPAWITDPETAARFIAGLPKSANPGVLGLLGVVIALAGLVFVLLGLRPGRPGRRALPGQRIAVVVDDEVLASALARRARAAATVRPEQVTVFVSQGEALVNVRPTSGVPVSAEAVLAAVEDELRRLRPEPYPVIRVRVAGTGVVGA
ncbi:hypothetical protein [Sinomonas sp. P47F7]|uniref:hypothetical protein n=1 Tax=Sinomonas sp. P47F7 TaxID=3410987 RepID=UPI003BF52465